MSLTRQISFTRAMPPADCPDETGSDITVDMAFASDLPYERWWGIEILDCRPESVRLARLNDGAALLYNHNWDDLRGHHVPGTIIADGHAVRGSVVLSWATDEGKTIALVNGNHLSKSSVGYEIHTVIEQTTGKDGKAVERTLDGRQFGRVLERCQRDMPGDLAAFRRALDSAAGPFERAADAPATYRVIDWEPLENSLVTVPADASVGIGRMAESDAATAPPAAPPPIIFKETKMENPTPVDVAALERDFASKAQQRIENIAKIGDQFADFEGAKEMANAAIRSGKSVEDFTSEIHGLIAKRGNQWKPEIGLTTKEAQAFSIRKAVQAMVTGDWADAGFEREASKAVASKIASLGVERSGSGKGFFIPLEVQKRDMLVATAANGGNMVATTLRPQDFIEMLRARMLSAEIGVRTLSGMVGNADITKHTGAATGYWLSSESTAITESQQTIGLLQLRPKNLGAYAEVTRQLLLQSTPDADSFIMGDLAKALAHSVDAAVFAGSGASGQPTGIIGTAGVGAVSGTSLGLAGLIECQTDVAAANALHAGCRYVATPPVAGLLTQRARIASTDSVTLWKGNINDGTVEGYQAHTSNNLPAATAIFGDFSQAILAEWGVLEVDVNPFANFAAGITGIRAFYTCDVGVRVPGAFTVVGTIT